MMILPDDSINFLKKEFNYTSPNEDQVIIDKARLLDNHTPEIGLKKSNNRIWDEKNDVQRYKHNQFIFNDNYKNKIKILNSNFNKELTFQKRLLKLKKNEKLLVHDIDFKKISEEYKMKFINKIKEDQKKLEKKSHIKHTLSTKFLDPNIIKSKQKQKIEQTILKSLDSKRLTKLRVILKETDSESVSMINKIKKQYEVEEMKENNDLIEETKKKMIEVEEQMVLINKLEMQTMKKRFPLLYSEKVIVSRKLLNTAHKKEYNKNFSKLNSYDKYISNLANSKTSK